jgi:hypothetical protein
MENMFELLATTPAVADEPGARSLRVSEGRVDFKEVCYVFCSVLKHCCGRIGFSRLRVAFGGHIMVATWWWNQITLAGTAAWCSRNMKTQLRGRPVMDLAE